MHLFLIKIRVGAEFLLAPQWMIQVSRWGVGGVGGKWWSRVPAQPDSPSSPQDTSTLRQGAGNHSGRNEDQLWLQE